MQEILWFVFIAVVAVQLLYYLVYLRFALAFSRRRKPNNNGISLIVYVKNETSALSEFLPSIIEQDHPNFEVVLINDSYYAELEYDETLGLMQEFAKKHANIKIVNVVRNETFWGNKKYALTLGIKGATHEKLIFTNLHNRPASNKWLSKIASRFSDRKSIVLGYNNYKQRFFSLNNAFYRYERYMASLQMFSFAKMGMPFTGTDNNLGFDRSEFYNLGGFAGHMETVGSADELFINNAANGYNTAICFAPKSHTRNISNPSFSAWFKEKRLKNQNRKHFKGAHKFHLRLFSLSQFLFWVMAALLVFVFPYEPQVLLTYYIILGRFALQFVINLFSAIKLREWDLPILSPLIEPFLLLTQIPIFIGNSFSKPNN